MRSRSARLLLAIALVAATIAPTIVRMEVAHAATPTFSVSDVTITEGDVKTRTATFAVTLSEPSTTALTVQYQITGVNATPGTATTANVDFNNRGGTKRTLTFLPRTVMKNLTVLIYPNAQPEPTETFNVSLSGASAGSAIQDALGVGTIVDDDIVSSNRVSISDTTIHEGNGTKRTATFAITLSKVPTTTVTVDYRIVPLTATSGYRSGTMPAHTDLADYLGVARKLTFQANGGVQRNVSVAVFPDTEPEYDETFNVVLSNLQGSASFAKTTGVGTIIDDDGDPPPGVAAPPCTRTISPGTAISLSGLGPGNTLCLRGGVYWGQTTLSVSGTASAPIWVTSVPGETAIIDGFGVSMPANHDLVTISGAYVTLANVHVRNSAGRGVELIGTGSRIRYSRVHAAQYNGIVAAGAGQFIEDNEVWNTVLSNTNGIMGSSGWAEAVNTWRATNTTIMHNDVHHNWGEGIDFIISN
ncbi:MAG TPA: Calx-beta domain-containing protein, partial [Acidimicrobiia bacterium]|nr:Calx-beta domain-containing protein [Acidimicrobiia bacterium]